MDSVNKRVIVIALVMAFFTTFLIYVYIKRATTKPEVVEYTNVYVAAKTLPPRHKIADADLKQAKVTREFLNSTAVLNKADILGKRLKDRIIEGEQILRDRLVDETDMTLAYNIPEGKRAVSINVTEQIEVANLIMPGDFVDVIGSFDKEEVENNTTKTVYPRITKTIIQNAQILAIGQEMSVGAEKKPEMPVTVTLALTPQEVENLVFASEYGILRLALRPVDDNEVVKTNGVIRTDLSPAKGVIILPK